jgi:hypothetical protein
LTCYDLVRKEEKTQPVPEVKIQGERREKNKDQERRESGREVIKGMEVWNARGSARWGRAD